MFASRLLRRRRATRRGVAAAELAIVLPVFLLLVMCSIEACTMIFLNHSLAIASYEGVRVAINFDATNSKVFDRCDELIDARDVEDATVSINPSNVATIPRGTPIAITVSAPCDANTIIPPWLYEGRSISVTTTMVKE